MTPEKDLVPVSLVAGVPFVLVVNPNLPVHSVADLVKLAKEKHLTYGSGGVGAFHHLNAELFSSMTGIKMTHVPYKGSVPAMTDAGRAARSMCCSSIIGPSIQLIRAGKARALGITSAEPAAAAPEIPAARQGRLAGLRHHGVADDRCAGQDAAARSLKSSTPRSMRRPIAGDGKPFVAISACSRSAKARCTELDAYVKSETARWAR